MSAGAAPTSLADTFNSVHALPATQRIDAYPSVLDEIYKKSGSELEENLVAYLISILASEGQFIAGVAPPSDPPSIIASRTLLSGFTDRLSKHRDAELQVDVAKAALQLIQPRAAAFEDQDTALKMLQAAAHEAQEEWRQSAQVLSSISLDSTSRNVTDTDRAGIWVRIMRCYLEEDGTWDSVVRSDGILIQV